jgi:anti-anti-sigma regulatory factor
MFRISQTSSRSQTIVNIDGRLTGEYVRLAEEYCTELLRAAKRLQIVLRDVSDIDDVGRSFLHRFASQGAHLHGKGVYMEHLVNQICRAAKKNTR